MILDVISRLGIDAAQLPDELVGLLAGLAPVLAGVPAVAKLKPWMTTALCVLLAIALSVAAIWQSPGGFDFSVE
jgi:hypothetical protein